MLIGIGFVLQCLLLAPFTEAQLPSLCPADQNEPWTYRGQNGPMFWGQNYPECNGKNQSPIDIRTRDVIKDMNLKKLEMLNYDKPITSADVENIGYSINVTPNDGVERTISVDGSTYKLLQFHFHWGRSFIEGSEHTIDGRQYAMEMHLVHRNEENEIAVVGIIFQETITGNAELQKVVDTLKFVRYKGQTTSLTSSVNLNKIVPENPASYYRYQGSLTTPGCAEGVTWSVLTTIQPVSIKQMTEFRQIKSATKKDSNLFCTQSGNYRPVQPLNGRQVRLSQ